MLKLLKNVTTLGSVLCMALGVSLSISAPSQAFDCADWYWCEYPEVFPDGTWCTPWQECDFYLYPSQNVEIVGILNDGQ